MNGEQPAPMPDHPSERLVVFLRLHPLIKRQIAAAAKAEDISISAWIRRELAKALPKTGW